jgi:amino acid transporter
MATTFVLLCGGPYGTEEAVPYAGPGLAIGTLIVMPFIWALPYVLLVAEMASSLPVQGGIYKWFRAAFGPFWSFQLSFLDWITWVLDAALYPPLLAGYLTTLLLDGSNRWIDWGICLAVIWGCTWINVRGIRSTGRASLIMSLVLLAPVFVIVLMGLPKIDLSNLLPLAAEDKPFGSALNYALIWAVWNYSGYAGLASASEEIVTPERSFPKILGIFLPLSVVVYAFPMIVALSVTPDWQSWETGHYTLVAASLGGVWLMVATSVGAQFAQVGLFNSEQIVISRMPYAMARDGLLPPWFAKLHPRYGTPARLLILQGVFYSALTFHFGFVELLVMSTWLALPSYLFTFVAPLILRWKRPDLRGPFRIPGGWPVIIPLAALPFAIALYVLVYVLLTEELDVLLMGFSFLAVIPLVYLWARRERRKHGITLPDVD